MQLQELPETLKREEVQTKLRFAFWQLVGVLEKELDGEKKLTNVPEDILENCYHFATKFTDMMTFKSLCLIAREVRGGQAPVPSRLFTRSLTGEYRNPKHMKPELTPKEILVYKEIFDYIPARTEQNPTNENDMIIQKISSEIEGVSHRNFYVDDIEYLKKHTSRGLFDSVDKDFYHRA